MFPIKFHTKGIYRIFHIFTVNRMTLFRNLFMDRPSYMRSTEGTSSLTCLTNWLCFSAFFLWKQNAIGNRFFYNNNNNNNNNNNKTSIAP